MTKPPMVSAGPNAQMTQTQNDLFAIRISAFELHHLFSLLYCVISILRETFPSVRGYGLRAYEPRQGRNAATVV